MTKTYPAYESPTMIYTSDNRYTIVAASDVPAFLAAGWSATPVGGINDAPSEIEGDVPVPEAPQSKAPKSKPNKE